MSSNTQLLVLVQNYSQEPVTCENIVKCADFGTIVFCDRKNILNYSCTDCTQRMPYPASFFTIARNFSYLVLPICRHTSLIQAEVGSIELLQVAEAGPESQRQPEQQYTLNMLHSSSKIKRDWKIDHTGVPSPHLWYPVTLRFFQHSNIESTCKAISYLYQERTVLLKNEVMSCN